MVADVLAYQDLTENYHAICNDSYNLPSSPTGQALSPAFFPSSEKDTFHEFQMSRPAKKMSSMSFRYPVQRKKSLL